MLQPSHHHHSAVYRVLVAVRDAEDLSALLCLGCALARANQGEVQVLTVASDDAPLPWLTVPEEYADVSVAVSVVSSRKTDAAIIEKVHALDPDVLLLGWRGQKPRGRYMLGHTLDPVIQNTPCNVIILRGDCRSAQIPQRILIPVAGGPNAPQAFDLAWAINATAQITALSIVPENLGQPGILVAQERLDSLLHTQAQHAQLSTQVMAAASPIAGILAAARQGHDMLIMGAGGENVVGRFIFGDIPQVILAQAPIPVLVVRRRVKLLDSLVRRVWARIFGMIPHLTVHEQAEVYKVVRRGSRPSPDFFVMITLAAAIAAMGLFLNSAIVIVGAMLVAPLMTAIIGMGLSIIIGDARFFWSALQTTVRGALLAIGTGFLVALVAPGAAVTPEILARANPNLLDLGIALAAGAAAAYAISRHDVSAALAGVAIAASLDPPLATVGIGVQFGEWGIAGGALLLFITNMVAIVAAAGWMFFLLGFHPNPERPERATMLRHGIRNMAVLLLLVTLPLSFLTARSLRETRWRQEIQTALEAELEMRHDIGLLNWNATESSRDAVLYIEATVHGPSALSYGEARALQEAVAARLQRPVALSLRMMLTTQLQAYIPPPPLLTASPTLIATPAAVPTSRPRILFIANVGVEGSPVHYAPGGMVMGQLPLDAAVEVQEGPVNVEGNDWYRVVAIESRLEGWVAAEFLKSDIE